MPQMTTNQRDKAYMILQEDAENIRRLIEVQIDNFSMPQCPLYEEVLDTQMFGLSREINFAVRLELISEKEGRQILEDLEKQLTILHDTASKNRTKKTIFNSRRPE